MLSVVLSAVVVEQLARGQANSCPHDCRDEERDGRGCCPVKQSDDANKADKAKRAEEARKAEEAKKADEQAARRAAAKRAEDARKATEQKQAEDARRAGEQRRADDARKAAEGSGAPKAAARATEGAVGAPSTTALGCPSGMVHVPGGTFKMGSPVGTGDHDEHPQHTVTLSGYCIDRTEATVAAYGRCVTSRKCTAATTSPDSCNGDRSDRQNHPVNCVDWNQAKAYCQWAGGRLPTEAEWEYAALGNDGRRYPWGNAEPTATLLNYRGTGTTPVGSYLAGASPFGAQDMAGNVWEWTADCFGKPRGQRRNVR